MVLMLTPDASAPRITSAYPMVTRLINAWHNATDLPYKWDNITHFIPFSKGTINPWAVVDCECRLAVYVPIPADG